MTGDLPTYPASDLAAKPLPSGIGVFICECGKKVASFLDVQALVHSTCALPGVAYAGCAPYWCSAEGRDRMRATIHDHALERIIVAGCSPRTHNRLFQEVLAQAGLSQRQLGMVNIREGCAWPHRRKAEAANRRARDQIRMEAAHIAAQEMHPLAQAQITPTALVIGGGVSGMTAAQELADMGIPVTLVERSAGLGGLAVGQNPELAADLSTAVQSHTGITVHLDSLITDVEGSVGSYRVTISRNTHPRNPSTDYEIQTTFGAIIVACGVPDQETANLARLLRLPQDRDGFLPEWRVRLRPDHFIERGIYVCGSAHFPCDATEAQFQAYSTASRALRHLRRGKVVAHGSIAQVEADKCNGCGDCVYACPFAAAAMTKRPLHPGEPGQPDTQRDEGLSLAVIDRLLCTGCGNCVSVCPVGAVTLAGWTDAQLEAQMQVALEGAAESAEPIILIFACAWSGYAAAELAGAQMLTYPPNLRLICLECSGRLQLGLILKALELGAAGVLVLGCAPRLCHYERGNQRAAAAQMQVEAITGLLGLPRARLQLAWVPPDDGPAFAELVTRFVDGVEEVGVGSTK